MTTLLQAVVVVLLVNWCLPHRVVSQDTVQVFIVATTDVHGQAMHWDYINDREAPWGLTRAAAVVDSLERAHPGQLVLVDAGDLIQGSPLATLFATERQVPLHPVIDALNAMRYDALIPGDHDFDFGMQALTAALQSAAFTVVAGNVYQMPYDTLRYRESVVVERMGVRVGVTGFTTPGSMLWHQAMMPQNEIEVRPIVPEAERALANLENSGTELIVAAVHSGMGVSSSYDTTGIGRENVASLLAGLQVKPHVVVVGHSHRTIADSVIDGVHFIQPAPWAQGVAIARVTMAVEDEGHRVVRVRGEQISLARVAPDPSVTRRLEQTHAAVRDWVDGTVTTAVGDWSARLGRAEDTPLIDFINEVQRRTAGADLSATAVFNPAGGLPDGTVRLRDVVGVYPHDNTLKALRIDGETLRAYLERSAQYFNLYLPGERVINPDVPGYDFDIVSGVSYVIDLSRPPGQRIRQLAWQGELVQATDTFTLALSNYRASGGGGFNMLADLPMVYNGQQLIHELLINAARQAVTLEPADYFEPSWQIIPEDAAAAVRAAVLQEGAPPR